MESATNVDVPTRDVLATVLLFIAGISPTIVAVITGYDVPNHPLVMMMVLVISLPFLLMGFVFMIASLIGLKI